MNVTHERVIISLALRATFLMANIVHDRVMNEVKEKNLGPRNLKPHLFILINISGLRNLRYSGEVLALPNTQVSMP